MAADRGIGLMEDRAGSEARLGHAEQGLHLEEITVADHRLKRGDAGIGAKDTDAIEPGLVSQLAQIHLEALAAGLEVAAVAWSNLRNFPWEPITVRPLAVIKFHVRWPRKEGLLIPMVAYPLSTDRVVYGPCRSSAPRRSRKQTQRTKVSGSTGTDAYRSQS